MFCLLSAKIYNKSDNNNVWRGIILIVFILQLILFFNQCVQSVLISRYRSATLTIKYFHTCQSILYFTLSVIFTFLKRELLEDKCTSAVLTQINYPRDNCLSLTTAIIDCTIIIHVRYYLKKTKSRLSMTRPRRSLKKRRSEDNIDRRTKSITLEPVPGHRFPLIVIQLCVLIYMRTPCGLRKVVTIQGHH